MIIKTLIQGEYEQYEDKKEQIEQDIRDQLRAKNILPLECSVAVSTTFEFFSFDSKNIEVIRRICKHLILVFWSRALVFVRIIVPLFSRR